MANSNPIYDPAQGFTVRASGANLLGARLVKVAAAKTNGEPVTVAYCGASDHPIGVLGADTAQDAVGPLYPTQVQLIEAGAAVTAGAAVEVMANGRVQTLASGRRVGVAYTAATEAGQFVLVQPLI